MGNAFPLFRFSKKKIKSKKKPNIRKKFIAELKNGGFAKTACIILL
jgi:hypothetical protein